MQWAVIVLLIYIFQMATILIVEYRRPTKAVAWLCILLVLPIVGFILYYFMAQEYRHRSRLKGRRTPKHNLTTHNEVKVFNSAKDLYNWMLKDIAQARSHVHMLYYIWNDDESGRTFQDALIRKALEGVSVRVLVDGVGARGTGEAFWNRMREAGVQVHHFLPPVIAFFAKRLNYRNHRKITVIDGQSGYIGGINIGDEYVGKSPKYGEWRDTAIRFAGEAVHDLQRTFAMDWCMVSGEALELEKELFPPHHIRSMNPVRIVEGGPDTEHSAIREMFFQAVVAAKRRIYITTPYFVPDDSLRMALITAAHTGVDVRLVIPGSIIDSKLTHWATLSYIGEMLRAGVRVYCYSKGFLHAKTVVVDDGLAIAGSANLDLRSFFSNFEINAVCYDEAVVRQFAKDVAKDMTDSDELTLSAYESRSRLEKCKLAVGHILSPLL